MPKHIKDKHVFYPSLESTQMFDSYRTWSPTVNFPGTYDIRAYDRWHMSSSDAEDMQI